MPTLKPIIVGAEVPASGKETSDVSCAVSVATGVEVAVDVGDGDGDGDGVGSSVGVGVGEEDDIEKPRAVQPIGDGSTVGLAC